MNTLLNEQEASRILNCALSTLRNWRFLGKGPPYIKFGRCVRYSETDLQNYLERHRIAPQVCDKLDKDPCVV